jgi:spore coat protein CotF
MSYRNIYNLMKGNSYDLSTVSFTSENNQVMRILTDQINSKEPLHIEEVTKYGQSQAFNQTLVKT